MELNRDFSDLLSAFVAHRVRFLLVGGYALTYYGRPRATGDMDLWVEPSAGNAQRVYKALAEFGAPLTHIEADDFTKAGIVFQIGVAPNRIDVLTSLTGLVFSHAWKQRRRARYGEIPISLLALRDFLRNKKELGRARDLADIEEIRNALPKRVGKKKPEL